MRPSPTPPSGFKRMVLRALPAPAWLEETGSPNDVVVSSRIRMMRNLKGHRFPNAAAPSELLEIVEKVRSACQAEGQDNPELRFRSQAGMTQDEYDHWVRLRMASPHFAYREPGRILLLNETRTASVMVNEEDHVRLQVLHAGFQWQNAMQETQRLIDFLSLQLEFAHTPSLGFVASCPVNCGTGTRISIMCHLIGLAHQRRLAQTLAWATEQGIVVRGMFGESSRGIGAFIQLSTLKGPSDNWQQACEAIVQLEQAARAHTVGDQIRRGVQEAIDHGNRSRTLTAVEALRVLAWVRWGVVAGLWEAQSPRAVDLALAMVEGPTSDDGTRAKVLHAFLDSLSRR